jgi:hypothetical protein
MGLFKMLFGGGASSDLQPGAWLEGLRDGEWTPVLDAAGALTGWQVSATSCIRENGNDFFVLRQSLAGGDHTKYSGCVRLSGASEVMVLVEREEAPDQSSGSGDFWAYDRLLTLKNTPALPQLIKQLGVIAAQRMKAAKPAYLAHLVKGLEAMTG